MKHFVLIGGTRFIGHATALCALQRGHRVTVIHRGVTRSELPFANELIADRNDPRALAQAVAKAKPDVVIDTRAMTRADAEATALAIKITAAPLVVLSSQDVYAQFGRLNGLPSPPAEERIREDSPLTVPRPFAGLGPHEGGPDYDKKDVESVVRDLAVRGNVRAVSLRLPAVYGSRDPKRRFGALVDAVDRGELELPCAPASPDKPGGSLRVTHVHVFDAAHAIVLAGEQAAGLSKPFSVFNVGELVVPTMRERYEAIAAAMGAAIRFRETTDDLPPGLGLLGAFADDCVMDTSSIRETLGYAEVLSPEEARSDVVAWLRASREDHLPG